MSKFLYKVIKESLLNVSPHGCQLVSIVSIVVIANSPITEHFIKEINLGIGDTNIKAGIIKIATYKGPITDLEKRIFRAAASASIETGTSITTHTYLGENALEQVDLLVANGVKPDKIVIGHLDDNKINLNLIRNIIDKGSYAQFDAIGCEYYSKRLNSQMPSDNERISAIKQLRADGLIDRIMIGSDLCLKKHLKKKRGSRVRTFG